MLIVRLSPATGKLQGPGTEIARAATVARATAIAEAAFTMYDSTMTGYLQVVSDRTGYVHAEWALYEYESPAEAVDMREESR